MKYKLPRRLLNISLKLVLYQDRRKDYLGNQTSQLIYTVLKQSLLRTCLLKRNTAKQPR